MDSGALATEHEALAPLARRMVLQGIGGFRHGLAPTFKQPRMIRITPGFVSADLAGRAGRGSAAITPVKAA